MYRNVKNAPDKNKKNNRKWKLYRNYRNEFIIQNRVSVNEQSLKRYGSRGRNYVEGDN